MDEFGVERFVNYVVSNPPTTVTGNMHQGIAEYRKQIQEALDTAENSTP